MCSPCIVLVRLPDELAALNSRTIESFHQKLHCRPELCRRQNRIP